MGEGTVAIQEQSRRKYWILIAGVFFILIGLLVFLYWLRVLRFKETTSDAYVNGNKVTLISQVSSIITAINADDTDLVEENQVLVELDKADYALALEKSRYQLAETVRHVAKQFIWVEEKKGEFERKKAELTRAEQDYQNRAGLAPIGAVSKEEFEHIEAALLSARASYRESNRALQAAYVQVENTTVRTHPRVMEASERFKEAYLNLKRCAIVSPVRGYVANRSAQLGERVSLERTLMTIIPLDTLWVDANFKETQLAMLRIGQPVRMTSDLYGKDVIFTGKVKGITAGTGSVFSPLPPQNATGNWIKIVQRVPVRVSLDPKELKNHPLWLGLSMHVSIDTHDAQGEMLTSALAKEPIYQTQIYALQEEGVGAAIEEIIRQNGGHVSFPPLELTGAQARDVKDGNG